MGMFLIVKHFQFMASYLALWAGFIYAFVVFNEPMMVFLFFPIYSSSKIVLLFPSVMEFSYQIHTKWKVNKPKPSSWYRDALSKGTAILRIFSGSCNFQRATEWEGQPQMSQGGEGREKNTSHASRSSTWWRKWVNSASMTQGRGTILTHPAGGSQVGSTFLDANLATGIKILILIFLSIRFFLKNLYQGKKTGQVYKMFILG